MLPVPILVLEGTNSHTGPSSRPSVGVRVHRWRSLSGALGALEYSRRIGQPRCGHGGSKRPPHDARHRIGGAARRSAGPTTGRAYGAPLSRAARRSAGPTTGRAYGAPLPRAARRSAGPTKRRAYGAPLSRAARRSAGPNERRAYGAPLSRAARRSAGPHVATWSGLVSPCRSPERHDGVPGLTSRPGADWFHCAALESGAPYKSGAP